MNPCGRGLGVTRASRNDSFHPTSQEQELCAYCHEETKAGRDQLAYYPGLLKDTLVGEGAESSQTNSVTHLHTSPGLPMPCLSHMHSPVCGEQMQQAPSLCADAP